jgi:nucleotide-binding universal stress UspA family protein
MKILIATDGSKHSNAAVEEFAKRSFTPATEIKIISAYQRSSFVLGTAAPMGALNDYHAEIDSNAKKEAQDAVEKAFKLLSKKHPKTLVDTVVVEGSPKNAILKEAEKFRADLIVVGSHGHGFVKRFLIGSVAQAVALHAPCSVEIVRKSNKKKK